jgi:three-Cys-motif partner protein
MLPPITYLPSADRTPWDDGVAASDRLPARPSGPWIGTKHKLLSYYAQMFATGMKFHWDTRVYVELFSGPGRCLMRETGKEDPGSPLKVIEHEFTNFIFTEISAAAAEALAKRLDPFPKSERAEIWCGDCADAVHRFQIPPRALTFAFIDPTGIAHAPFSLIEALHRKTRCDFLINVQHGMGIKMNIHQYTPDADDASALTKFLGHDGWKSLPRHNAREFFLGVLDLYKKQLERLGYKFIGREVQISNTQGTNLYLLLFASGHERGQDFWQKSLKGVLEPELDLST